MPNKKKLYLFLGLLLSKGIGYSLYYDIIDSFKDLEELSSTAGRKKLKELIKYKVIKKIPEIDLPKIRKLVENEIDNCKKEGIEIILYGDKNYPELLKSIVRPPIVLYCQGERELLSERCIALIGTRRASISGKKKAFEMASGLSAKSFTVVSGLARGIDASVHNGALSVKNGKTVAVLGCGINIIYPKQNYNLFQEIKDRGLLISEFPLNSKPLDYHFPQRNRIISGLSEGVVVIEAPQKSGALITVRYALEQGRDVMAFPGKVSSANSIGVNNLLRDGAFFVENANDIVKIIAPEIAEKDIEKSKSGERIFNETERKILSVLSKEEKNIEEIITGLELEPNYISELLMRLEIEGLIFQKPGKTFVLNMGNI